MGCLKVGTTTVVSKELFQMVECGMMGVGVGNSDSIFHGLLHNAEITMEELLMFGHSFVTIYFYPDGLQDHISILGNVPLPKY